MNGAGLDILDRDTLEAKAFWLKTLSSDFGNSNLPLDYTRSSRRGIERDFVSLSLEGDIFNQMLDVTGGRPFLTYTLLMAALKLCLHRYTGSVRISVGTAPIKSNGALIDVAPNALVIVDEVRSTESFRQLLLCQRNTLLEAHRRDRYPFRQLVADLGVKSEPGRSPLYDVALLFTSLQQDLYDTGNDITIKLDVEDHGIRGTVFFNRNLFQRDTILRFAGRYTALLSAALKNIDLPVSALCKVGESEAHQMTIEWNDTGKEYGRERGIGEVFEEEASRGGDRIAVVYEGEQISYGELDGLGNQVARYLRREGVGEEGVVGVMMERGIEMVGVMVGILKGGGAYVPLDSEYPEERLKYMVEDAGLEVIVRGEGGRRLWEKEIELSEEWSEIRKERREKIGEGGRGGNLAYIMYTSGSTGRPKGVSIEQRGVVRLVKGANYAELGEGEVMMQGAPISFDASTLEIWGSLLNGGRLEVVGRGKVNVEEISEEIEKRGITTVWLTAGLFQEVVRRGTGKLRGLRQIVAGGDVLPMGEVKEVVEKLKGVRMTNGYGPTENTTFTCCEWVKEVEEGRSIPIGRPVTNTEAYIYGSGEEVAGVGVIGELYTGGEGLARCYHGKAEATAERFVPDGMGRRAGGRLYRTGDLARWLGTGEIEFRGRVDNQVKIRGYRIELGEIDLVLQGHPDVKTAVTVAFEGPFRDKALLSHLVPNEGTVIDREDLHRFLKVKLPDFMMPMRFEVVNSLPMTASGKVDRNWLATAARTRTGSRRAAAAPRDAVELELSQIWEDTLGVSPVGVMDDFFEVGGHSLLAVRLMSRIKESFGTEMPLATLFERRTIEDFAVLLRQEANPRELPPLVGIRPSRNDRPFFCVHAAGGNPLCYWDLAQLMEWDQGFYAFRSYGLNPLEPMLGSIEEMAAQYIEFMLDVQSKGPYYLGGWSLGGVIAYEMAQQLLARGEDIALLALIDTVAPGSPYLSKDTDDLKLLDAFCQSLGISPEHVHLGVRATDQALSDNVVIEFLREARTAEAVPPAFSISQARRLFQVFKTNVAAMHQYSPKPISCNVKLMKAETDLPAMREDGTLGWDGLIKTLEVCPVPGGHYELLKSPSVRVLASRLSELLRAAQESCPNSPSPYETDCARNPY